MACGGNDCEAETNVLNRSGVTVEVTAFVRDDDGELEEEPLEELTLRPSEERRFCQPSVQVEVQFPGGSMASGEAACLIISERGVRAAADSECF